MTIIEKGGVSWGDTTRHKVSLGRLLRQAQRCHVTGRLDVIMYIYSFKPARNARIHIFFTPFSTNTARSSSSYFSCRITQRIRQRVWFPLSIDAPTGKSQAYEKPEDLTYSKETLPSIRQAIDTENRGLRDAPPDEITQNGN